MTVYETIINRRTIRKFMQEEIHESILMKLVDAARFAPSGANLQPLKYIIIKDKVAVNTVFECVKWAAYLSPEGAPKEAERPVAFIAVLADKLIKKAGYEIDAGAAIQNILLAAKEEGIGSCWMGAIDRLKISNILDIDENYVLVSVIALGYEGEHPITEDETESIKYYKDKDGLLHVPKRKLEDIIIKSI